MTSSGKLAYLYPPVPVDVEFAAREAARGNPERADTVGAGAESTGELAVSAGGSLPDCCTALG